MEDLFTLDKFRSLLYLKKDHFGDFGFKGSQEDHDTLSQMASTINDLSK